MLDRLLGRQLGRLRRRFAVHGLGYVVAALCIALTAYYLIDRTLRLPGPVRVVLTLGVCALVFAVARRRLIYPLQRRFSRTDIALALERTFPQLRQSLVSAFQLNKLLRAPSEELRNQSPEMIGRLVDATADEVRDLPVDRVLDVRRTVRVWAVAGGLLAVIGVGIALQSEAVSVFAQRLFGANAAYPRETRLYVELPEDSEAVQIERDGRSVTVTIASQTDLHVTVRAEGVVPRDVYLVTTGANGERELATSPRAEGRFRHVFRRVQGELRFFARGGDDDFGDLDVTVQTIDPPLVARIAATIQPPAYTGADPIETQGGGIEALDGSSVRIEIQPTASVTSGELVFEESERRIPLASAPPPSGDGDPLWVCEFAVQGNDRYRVQLLGDTGLTNPQSGTYAVVALSDFAPVGRLLTPDSSNLALLPTGIAPVRAEFRDDWGVTAAELSVQTARADNVATLDLLPEGHTQATEIAVVHLFAVAQLSGGEEDQGNLGLQIRVRDNRAPAQQETELPTRQLMIVDQGQLGSHIHRMFRGVREDVDEALSLQEDRLARLEGITDSMAGEAKAAQGMLSAIEVGQGRVRSLAVQAHERLMQAFDVHLFNGLEDENATAAICERYLAYHRAQPSPKPHAPGFYSTVRAQRQQGELQAMPRVLDPILAMIALAQGVAEIRSPACVRALTEAQVANDASEATEYCRNALEQQKLIVSDLKDLLERLGEWNDIQDLIQEARSLRDKQRDVQSRTEELERK